MDEPATPPPAAPAAARRGKVLWRKEAEADNRTPQDFLEALVINADLPQRRYRDVVWASMALSQQLSSVSLTASISYKLKEASRLGMRKLDVFYPLSLRWTWKWL
jgi:hypothetical protein